MSEHDSLCETCGDRALWIVAESGPPARLAFVCEEHVASASLAPLTAVEAAVDACRGLRDGVLAAVWQSISDRYPNPVRLDADLRARAGISPSASWDVLRRPPIDMNRIGITARIQDWPRSPPGRDQLHDEDENGT